MMIIQTEKKKIGYFKGDELAARVWSTMYVLKDSFSNLYELTLDDMHHRLAGEIACIGQRCVDSTSENDIGDEYSCEKSIRSIEQVRFDSVIAKNYNMGVILNSKGRKISLQETNPTMERTQTSIVDSRLAHFAPTQRDEIVEWVTDYVDEYYDRHISKRLDSAEERIERLEKIPNLCNRTKMCSYFVEEKAQNYRYGKTIDDLNEELRVGFRKMNKMPAFVEKLKKWNSDGVLQFRGSNKKDIFDELIFCFYEEGELSPEELKQKWDVFRKACAGWSPK